jgi:hypothetical protein
MEIRRNYNVTVFWQILDVECRDDQWHLKVGTQYQTLLKYPGDNISMPRENYTDYKVSAVPGRCESDGQKINVTLTILVSEQVDINEYVFCRITISDPNSNGSNNTSYSRVSFVIYNDITTTTLTSLTSTYYATPTRVTGTTTDYESVPDDTTGTSSVAHTKVMHHVLLLSVLLALLLHFIH